MPAVPTGFLSLHKETDKLSATYSMISATVSSPADNDDTLGYDWIASFNDCASISSSINADVTRVVT